VFGGREGRKRFFFEKKKQKTFIHLGRSGLAMPEVNRSKSFASEKEDAFLKNSPVPGETRAVGPGHCGWRRYVLALHLPGEIGA
jgi:hypothetical protein